MTEDKATLPKTNKPSPTSEEKINADEPQQRPDPAFKRLVEQLVLYLDIDTRPTELKIKQLTSPDLFLEIPPGTNLENTLFDFFRRYTIIEFKSRNDSLDEPKLLAQIGRVQMWLSEQPKGRAKETLNVIVVAHRPPRVLKEIEREWGVSFEKSSRQGFYQLRIPPQDIVLVACDELPVEPKYAVWLLFAEAKSETWRKAIIMMAKHKLLDLLEEAKRLYPKEYRAMKLEIDDVIANFTPTQKEEYFNESIALYAEQLNRMPADKRAKFIAQLSPEERLKGLPPEEVAKVLSSEERLKGLPPEEIVRAIPSEEVAKVLTPEEQQLLRKLQEKLGQSQLKPTDDAK